MFWAQQLEARLRQMLLATLLIFECVTLPQSLGAQTASTQTPSPARRCKNALMKAEAVSK
jgi:hypothetical protein